MIICFLEVSTFKIINLSLPIASVISAKLFPHFEIAITEVALLFVLMAMKEKA